MARRRYRKYFRYPRKRWSPNIQRINLTEFPPGGNFFNSQTLAQNPAQYQGGGNATSVSQTYTVKNIELTISAESSSPAQINNLEYYIIYVPQGYAIGRNLPLEHPEWVMAYRYVGSPISYNGNSANSSLAQPPKIISRLSRKLQTGDSIIFFYCGTSSQDSTSVVVQGLCRWWTRAN